MRVVSALRYLFDATVVILGRETFFALNPRWHAWEKGICTALAFACVITLSYAANFLKLPPWALVLSFAARELLTILTGFVLAQFIAYGLEDMVYRWTLDSLESIFLCAAIFVIAAAVCLLFVVSVGMVTCDCRSPTCFVCSYFGGGPKFVRRKNRRGEEEEEGGGEEEESGSVK